MLATDQVVTFLLVVIGIVAGIVLDWLAAPSWLTRQFSGSTRGIITSALVGVAGAFVRLSHRCAACARRRARDARSLRRLVHAAPALFGVAFYGPLCIVPRTPERRRRVAVSWTDEACCLVQARV